VRQSISWDLLIVTLKTCYTVVASKAINTACHTRAKQHLTCPLSIRGPHGVSLAGAGGAHGEHGYRNLHSAVSNHAQVKLHSGISDTKKILSSCLGYVEKINKAEILCEEPLD